MKIKIFNSNFILAKSLEKELVWQGDLTSVDGVTFMAQTIEIRNRERYIVSISSPDDNIPIGVTKSLFFKRTKLTSDVADASNVSFKESQTFTITVNDADPGENACLHMYVPSTLLIRTVFNVKLYRVVN